MNTISGTVEVNGNILITDTSPSSTSSIDHLNQGLVSLSSATALTYFDSFLNEGVFIDFSNIVSAIDNGFTQNGILIKPLRRVTSNDIKERTIIYKHPTSTWQVDADWYNPKNTLPFQRPVGTFRPTDSSFLPSESGVGAFKFNVNLSRPTITREVILEQNNSPCPHSAPSIFTQSVSNDWFDPLNWSNGLVPDGCSYVQIDNVKAIIESDSKARAKNIDSSGTGTWEAEEGSVVEIGF